jgi:hypothetical protein
LPKIVYIQYANPAAYPPLQHSSQILADLGWHVTFLGAETESDANRLAFPRHCRIDEHRLGGARSGWRRKLHFVLFCIWSIGWTVRRRPQAVYCSDARSCPVGLLLYLLGMRVIYHEHDAPDEATSHIDRAILWMRKQLARRTNCIVPSSGRADVLRKQTGASSVFVVWNCPRRFEAEFDRAAPPSNVLRLIYQGSIVPARLPLALVDAMGATGLANRVLLRIAGFETVGSRDYVHRLKQRAQELGVSHCVEYMGSLDRQKMLNLARESNVGISLFPMMDTDVNHATMVGASNKAFDYLSQGVSVLVNCEQQWQELYVQTGYGRCCDSSDSSSIANALRWFLEHPEETASMGQAGRCRIQREWNYETQFAPVLSFLNSQVGKDPGFRLVQSRRDNGTNPNPR